jgi:hypothetical protein
MATDCHQKTTKEYRVKYVFILRSEPGYALDRSEIHDTLDLDTFATSRKIKADLQQFLSNEEFEIGDTISIEEVE